MKNLIIVFILILLLIGCSSGNVEKGSTNESNKSKKVENQDGVDGNTKKLRSSLELKDSFTAMDDVTFDFSGNEKKYAVGDQLYIVEQNVNGYEAVFNVSVAKHGKWESIKKEVLVSEELFAKADGNLSKDAEVEYMFLKDAFYRVSYEPRYVKEIENTAPITKVLYDNTMKIHKITFDTDASPIVEKIHETTVPQKHNKMSLSLDHWSRLTIVETNSQPIYQFVTKESLEPTGTKNGFIAQFISQDGKIIYEVKDQEIINLFVVNPIRYLDLNKKLIFVNQGDLYKSNVYSYKNNEFLYENNGAPSKLEPPKQKITISNGKKGYVFEQPFDSKGKIYDVTTFEKTKGHWVKVGKGERIKLNSNTIYSSGINHGDFFSIDNENLYIFQEIEYRVNISRREHHRIAHLGIIDSQLEHH